MDSNYKPTSGGALRDDDEDYEADEDAEDDEGVRGSPRVYKSNSNLDRIPVDSQSAKSIRRWGNQEDWIRSPHGFVVVAACQDYQKAKERPVTTGPYRRHGVLTHWLLDTVRMCPLDLSAEAVYNRVSDMIHNVNNPTTPDDIYNV